MINFIKNFFKQISSKHPFSVDRAVIGIGNIGDEYQGTRHNIGFDIVGKLSDKMASFTEEKSCHSYIAKGALFDSTNIVLVRPETFVNKSGVAVSELISKFDITTKRCLVVLDDFNIPLGKLRFREKGSAGGHNGLKSIISSIGDDFPRLRVGIGPLPKGEKIIDFVLGKFMENELILKKKIESMAVEAVECFYSDGIYAAMNKYNGK